MRLRDLERLDFLPEEEPEEFVPPPRRYPVHLESDTFVVSGPLHRESSSQRPGRRMTWREAEEWATRTYGRILGRVRMHERWAFRVLRPEAGGRYTPPPEESLPERARRGQ